MNYKCPLKTLKSTKYQELSRNIYKYQEIPSIAIYKYPFELSLPQSLQPMSFQRFRVSALHSVICLAGTACKGDPSRVRVCGAFGCGHVTSNRITLNDLYRSIPIINAESDHFIISSFHVQLVELLETSLVKECAASFTIASCHTLPPDGALQSLMDHTQRVSDQCREASASSGK